MPPPDPLTSLLTEWSGVFMSNSMRNSLRHAKESGLTMPQIGALFRIFHKGNVAVSDIGEELGITRAAASQLLERLVQQGLILRSEDPVDRRMKQIVLTSKGHQVLQESISARQSWFEHLASALSASEKEQVTAALELLIERANHLAPDMSDKLS